MQGVDKQSDSDRLCLHSLFSNRPTQRHQWGAHMHGHTCKHTLNRVAPSFTHIYTPSVSFALVHKPSYTQCDAGLSANTRRHTKWKKKKEASRAEENGLVLNAFLPRLQCWGNGAIMTRDERATMVSSLSLMFHCTVKKKLLAFSSAH